MDFPYEAKCPSNAKKQVFRGIKDVYAEIINIYDATEEQGLPIGQSLYSSCAFFADYSALVDSKMQNTIKAFNYCKTFSCSPNSSLNDTPYDTVSDFMVIEQEYNLCMQYKQKEVNNA